MTEAIRDISGNKTEGYLVDVLEKYSKDDYQNLLLLKNEKGISIVSDRMTCPFWVETSESVMENVKRKTGIEATLLEKKTVYGTKNLYEIRISNPRYEKKKILDNLREEGYFVSYGDEWSGLMGYLINKKDSKGKRVKPFDYIVVRGDVRNGILDAEEIEVMEKDDFKPRLITLDLEVYNAHNSKIYFPKPGYMDFPIIMAGVHDGNDGKVLMHTNKPKKEYSISYKDEKEMILELVRWIKETDPDFIITQNGLLFDFPTLEARAEKHRIKLDIGRDGSMVKKKRLGMEFAYHANGRSNIDLFPFIYRVYSLESRKLDGLTRTFLGRCQKNYDVGKRLAAEWDKGETEELEEYALDDAIDLYLIEEKIGLAKAVANLSNMFGLFPEELLLKTPDNLADFICQKASYKNGGILYNGLPTRKRSDELKNKGIGARRGRFDVDRFDSRHLALDVIEKNKKQLTLADREAIPVIADFLQNKIGELEELSGITKESYLNTMSSFLKDVAFYPPELVIGRKHIWRDTGLGKMLVKTYRELLEELKAHFESQGKEVIRAEWDFIYTKGKNKVFFPDWGRFIYNTHPADGDSGHVFTKGIKLVNRQMNDITNETMYRLGIASTEYDCEKLLKIAKEGLSKLLENPEIKHIKWPTKEIDRYLRKDYLTEIAAKSGKKPFEQLEEPKPTDLLIQDFIKRANNIFSVYGISEERLANLLLHEDLFQQV